MLLPTFLIAGVPKGGTTALWEYLNEHPEIFMARVKEPHFFSRVRGTLENGVRRPGPARFVNFNKGVEWYESLFDGSAHARARGEASTEYFSAPDSPDLIKEFIPDVRMIYLLRDPVIRLYSHFWYDQKLGWEGLHDHKITGEDDPLLQYYVGVSHYRVHLERHLSKFSRDRILILLYEDLNAQPLETFRKVCRFLGVDPGFVPAAIGKAFNPQTLPRFRFLTRAINKLRYTEASDRLPRRLRTFLGNAWRSFDGITMVAHRYPPMSPALRSRFVECFADDIDYVEKLVGRSLDSWRAA